MRNKRCQAKSIEKIGDNVSVSGINVCCLLLLIELNFLQQKSWFVETDENVGVQEVSVLFMLDTLMYIRGVQFSPKPEFAYW